MGPQSGSYPAKKLRVSVSSGQQNRQDTTVQVFGQVTTRTEPNRWPKTGPLAGYPDPLLTLGAHPGFFGIFVSVALRGIKL
jgi:hypothetical protein